MSIYDATTKRLRSFCDLEVGWYEGCGVPCNKKDMEWFIDLFSKNYIHTKRMPLVFPTPDGDISLEWYSDNHSIGLEVYLETHIADGISFDDTFFDMPSLDKSDDWNYINDLVRNMYNGTTSD